MRIGEKVEFDGINYIITYIEDRNTYEPLEGVVQIGDVVILEDETGNKIQVYDFDL